MYDFSLLEKSVKDNKKKLLSTISKSNNQKVIKRLPTLHDQVFAEVDCLSCANCCKHYSPRFKPPDIKRISKHLRMRESAFILEYLDEDSDGDFVLKQSPCAFLGDDNHCSIYEVRPRDCQRYPYTDEDVLVKQPALTIKNATICPAVYKILEKLGCVQLGR